MLGIMATNQAFCIIHKSTRYVYHQINFASQVDMVNIIIKRTSYMLENDA